jgi:hypothetical protein
LDIKLKNKADGVIYGYSREIKIVTLDRKHILISLFLMKQPSYSEGELIDTLIYKNNKAIYKNKCEDDPTCVITFTFIKNGIEITQNQADLNNGCGFGQGVIGDGFYKRKKNIKPTKKEILVSFDY